MQPLEQGPVTTQQIATALLSVFEGCRLTAYQDSGGVWTIGIGHTGADVTPGLTISAQQAADLFARDQAPLLKAVASLPPLAAAALLSFGFNCGYHALQNVLWGADQLTAPRHTTDRKGNVLAGLVARRRLEYLLYCLGMELSLGVASPPVA